MTTHIILDLDQTIISAETPKEIDLTGQDKIKAKKFTFHDMDNYYIVFERPGLQKFLDFLFANFSVSVWTAASKDYAAFIIKNIILADKSNRKLNWVFFCYHTDIAGDKLGGYKNLKMLWDEFKLPGMTNENTIIIDDNEDVEETNTKNAILIKPFEYNNSGSEGDKTLKILKKIFKENKGKPNFPESTKKKYNELK